MAEIFPGGKVPERYFKFRGPIERAAKKYGVPVEILWGLLHKESSGNNPERGADKHGRGAFQIDDRYHMDWLQKNDMGLNIETAADKAASILAADYKRPGIRDWHKAAAAYNAGVGGVRSSVAQGLGPDGKTANKKYGAEVMSISDQMNRKYLGQIPPETPTYDSFGNRLAPVREEPAPDQYAGVPDYTQGAGTGEAYGGGGVAGLGVSTNPLLLAMEAIRGAIPGDAREKPLDAPGSIPTGGGGEPELQAEPVEGTNEQYVQIKSPRRTLREMQAEAEARAASEAKPQTRDDNSMLRILKAGMFPEGESAEPDNKNPYTARRK